MKLLCSAFLAVLLLTFAACESSNHSVEPSAEPYVEFAAEQPIMVTDQAYSEEDETGTRVGTYTGEWLNDKPNGVGKYDYIKTQIDGSENHVVAEGTFVDGKLNGDDCSQVWDDGSSYVGQVSNGKSHGQGIYTASDGTVFEGQYNNGKYDGKVKVSHPDGGWIFDLVWSDNVAISGQIYQGSNMIFDGKIPSADVRFAEDLFGEDPKKAVEGFDDESFAVLEASLLKAIREADPDKSEMEFVVSGLDFAVYKIRKSLDRIFEKYSVDTVNLLFSWEQAYADPEDTKSEKIGVKFSVISVTKTPFGEKQADIERFYSEAAAVAATLPDDPREAAIALDKYMCETFDYDYEALESGRISNLLRIDDITIDDFFDNKLGVCAHYGSFSYAVLTAKGIPARICLSELSMEHLWHQVLVDGEWLNIDSTWNDTDDAEEPQFMLLTDDEFRADFNSPHYNWTVYE